MKQAFSVILLFLSTCCCMNNPYEVLGVKRGDPLSVIKSAYRQLAKEFHPDKNKDNPNAEEEMIKFNEAYEILSDPKKKEQFDTYGNVNENFDNSAHHHFFHEFRKGHSFVFDDFMFGSSFYSHGHKRTNLLTRYSYQNIVLLDSYHKVFFIFVYGDLCFECLRLQPFWEKLSENLNGIGVGMYEFNYDRDRHLAFDIGAQGYPQFIAVIAGRAVKYKSNEITERGIRDFLSALVPHNLITRVSSNHREYFEQSFRDNKPQCLLFSKHIFVPLLFELVAYEYKSKVKFAYVDVKDLHTKKLREKYKINTHDPAVVVVKEEPSTPVAIARGTALKRGTLRELVADNLYLFVPRLSSQPLFDDLCPKKSASHRWFCVVLVTNEDSSFSSHLWKLRLMAKDDKYIQKRVRFFYIFENVQTEFIKSFERKISSSVPCSDGTAPMKLLVVWRLLNNKVMYDWFLNGWCASDSSVQELENYLNEHTNGEVELPYETTLTNLKDEHWHGVFWDFIKNTYIVVQHVVDSIDSPSWYNLSSIGFVLLVIAGITLSCIIPFISEFITDKPTQDLPRHTTSETNTIVLGLQKLDVKSEKKFIHNSPSGKITVAVVVDSSNLDDVASSPITQAFADAIYRFTSNSSYSFTWVSISENLMWCTEIMNVNKFGEFLPGTVLAMNGFRKYVYVFKASSDEGNSKPQLSAKFIGLESSDDESDSYHYNEGRKIKAASIYLRRELPLWLDRLFDGTLPNKIKLQKWPKMQS